MVMAAAGLAASAPMPAMSAPSEAEVAPEAVDADDAGAVARLGRVSGA